MIPSVPLLVISRSVFILSVALGMWLVGCSDGRRLTSAEQQWREIGGGTLEPQWPIEVLSGGHKLLAIRERRERRGNNPASGDLVTEQIEWGWRAVMKNNGQLGGTLSLTYEVLDADSFVVTHSTTTQFLEPGETVSFRGNGFAPIEDRERLRQGNLRANWMAAYVPMDTTMNIDALLQP
jgi:hypothetical protein